MSGQNLVDLRAILEAKLPDMSAGGIKVLLYIIEHHAVSVSRISKDLSLAKSIVLRALSELGEDMGAGLLLVDDSGLVRLTDRGRGIRHG